MGFQTYEKVNLGLGLLVLIGSAWFFVSKTIKTKKILQLQKLYHQAIKTNLNQISIKKQSSQKTDNYFLNRPIAIQKVLAYFGQNSVPTVQFIQGRYDDFPKIRCSSFNIVEKTLNKSSYELYKVNVIQTLASQNVLIPNLQSFNIKNISNQPRLKILTSASTLGIIGTLSLSSDSSSFTINANIIGVDLDQIRKYVNDEKLYNMFGIILSCIGMIFGTWWLLRVYQEKTKQRIPLQASLLGASKYKR